MRWLRLAFWAALVAVTIAYVVPRLNDWHAVSRIRSIHLAWLILAAAILSLQYGLIFALWVRMLRVLGSPLPVMPAVRAFSLSLLPKYVPGKVVSQGVRARLAAEAGVPLLTLSTSLVLEMALGIGSAGAVALLGLVLGLPTYLTRLARWLAIALGLGSAVLLTLFVARFRERNWARWKGGSLAALGPFQMAALLALYTGGWGIAALAHWALAQAIQPLPFRTVTILGMALAIAWGIGALSVFVPAGLGVKDGILYLAVRGLMGDQNALIFAALSRFLSVAVECVITAAYWALAWARPSTPPPDSSASSPPAPATPGSPPPSRQ